MDKPLKLNNGLTMPPVGVGTWRMDDDEAGQSVAEAIKLGYRLIDTAKVYGNEQAVGQAIRDSGVTREQLFVTTKLWNDDQGYHTGRAAFEASLERLGMEYVDLYLIHWPATDQRMNTWRALENINEEGLAKSIGVSNYAIPHLEEVLAGSHTVPAVNQIEFHPFIYEQQKPTLEYCKQKGIVVEAWSPLHHGEMMDHEVITKIAKETKRTNAQVMLRWAVQHGTVPLPKSTHKERLLENIQIFDFELSDKQMSELNQLSASA